MQQPRYPILDCSDRHDHDDFYGNHPRDQRSDDKRCFRRFADRRESAPIVNLEPEQLLHLRQHEHQFGPREQQRHHHHQFLSLEQCHRFERTEQHGHDEHVWIHGYDRQRPIDHATVELEQQFDLSELVHHCELHPIQHEQLDFA